MKTGKIIYLKDLKEDKVYKCVAYRIGRKEYCYLCADERLHRPFAFYQYEIDRGDLELL